MKIGLLPLYIKLYDDFVREIYRPRLDPFYETVVRKFESFGVEVVTSPFCRLKDEFDAAVKSFVAADVDCIVTLHMAYSPSLESAEVLARTELPIVILDTTETYDFSDTQARGEISFNHGIHGVMDMCNLLKRKGKEYAIAAGHIEQSDVLERTLGFVRAAQAARELRTMKVGTIGGSFDGMGDFIVTDKELKDSFGVDVVYGDRNELSELAANVSDAELTVEINSYKSDFRQIDAMSDEALENTARCALAVRNWIDKYGLGAFTVNFLKIGDESGIDVMPFVEACKQLSRGVGYAGEGDVLTASVVGALIKHFNETSFIEIFCPDWKNDRVFISHMGEMNLALCADKPEIKEIRFRYGQNAKNPVVSYGCYKSGDAVFVNLYRDADGFAMLLSPVKVEVETTDNFVGSVRGWLRPICGTAEFLEKLSYAGVTHHSALVYGAKLEQLEFFGRLLGIKNRVVVR